MVHGQSASFFRNTSQCRTGRICGCFVLPSSVRSCDGQQTGSLQDRHAARKAKHKAHTRQNDLHRGHVDVEGISSRQRNNYLLYYSFIITTIDKNNGLRRPKTCGINILHHHPHIWMHRMGHWLLSGRFHRCVSSMAGWSGNLCDCKLQ